MAGPGRGGGRASAGPGGPRCWPRSAIGAGPAAGSPGGLVASGRAAYDAGRFAEALGAFERAIALGPAAAVPRYDSAATLFQLGRYPEAIARYQEARDRGDPGLATKIDYALGNAQLALGEIPEALAHYDACLASTWPGPAFDAVRRDAAENRAFAASRTPPPPDEPGGAPAKASRTGPDRPTTAPSARGPGSPGERPSARCRPTGRVGRAARRSALARGRTTGAARRRPTARADRPRPGSTPRSARSARPASDGPPRPPGAPERAVEGLVSRSDVRRSAGEQAEGPVDLAGVGPGGRW